MCNILSTQSNQNISLSVLEKKVVLDDWFEVTAPELGKELQWLASDPVGI